MRIAGSGIPAATVASCNRDILSGQSLIHRQGIPGALKNAMDFLFREWNNKAAGFVSYGSAGGARAVEQLRLVMAEVQIATIRNQVLLSLFTDFENFSVFKPAPQHEKSVNELFDQVIAWSSALKALR